MLSKLTKSVHINTVAIEITLVMVTHDVGLKNFADRVIWMRDGKIMRLEVIPEDIREQRHEQLDKDLEVRWCPVIWIEWSYLQRSELI